MNESSCHEHIGLPRRACRPHIQQQEEQHPHPHILHDHTQALVLYALTVNLKDVEEDHHHQGEQVKNKTESL